MPFRSVQQERWAFATKQPFAKQWAAITDQKRLPRRVSKSRKEPKMAQSNFDALAAKLSKRGNVSNPRALAAYIGRKKYGGSTMAKASARGVSAASVAKRK